jgi:hypothetical protein
MRGGFISLVEHESFFAAAGKGDGSLKGEDGGICGHVLLLRRVYVALWEKII